MPPTWAGLERRVRGQPRSQPCSALGAAGSSCLSLHILNLPVGE